MPSPDYISVGQISLLYVRDEWLKILKTFENAESLHMYSIGSVKCLTYVD